MAIAVQNKVADVLRWHAWCAQEGFSHTETDQRDFITRRFGDLPRDIQDAIHTEALAARK